MQYNNLGKAGIKVSELSFGSWLTFGNNLDTSAVKKLMRRAYERGVNFFDNAEAYAKGQAEVLMGEALKDYRREDLVVSTKIFWGGQGPNGTGISWKRLVEGTANSLKRLKLDYVDLLFCHRPDPTTPIEETVRAMDHIVRNRGWAFYWGTSEWSAIQLDEAFRVADELNLVPPSMEQPQYNMLVRERVEKELGNIFKRHRLGTTIWSPLASGILSGKYCDGLPRGSRLDHQEWLRDQLTPENLAKVRKLTDIARELGGTMAQLAIAWCLRNPNVSTVILGATTVEQLDENLDALKLKDELTPPVLKRIDDILGNRS